MIDSRFLFNGSAPLVAIFCWLNTFAATGYGQRELTGDWDCYLESPGGRLRFGLRIVDNETGELSGFFVNGVERIKIPSVKILDDKLVLSIDHYDSEIRSLIDGDSLRGNWRKRRGPNEWVEMTFAGQRSRAKTTSLSADQAEMSGGTQFAGRWLVRFERSDEPAVGLFKAERGDAVSGTFLTTTGDYRYLYGFTAKGRLELSCFDGAHAFLFHAALRPDGTLSGDFWSSNNWHERWRGTRAENATLPNPFTLTKAVGEQPLGSLSFPDLDGKPTRLDDARFAAPARLIYVFGSWCPNCHDAADYFRELRERFGPEKLSIVGLAFEVSGDFERDARQVRVYLQRHRVEYPVLIAGLSDKKEASRALPFLDQVRSYPTTIFLDGKQNVRAVHTGFCGPATGKEYQELKEQFESLIVKMIAEDDRQSSD